MRNDQLTAFRWRGTVGAEVQAAPGRVRVASARLLARGKNGTPRLGELEPVLAQVRDEDARLYDPLREAPELVGRLAALPANAPEAWAAFASVYGFLREPQGHRVRVYGEGFPPSGQLACAESVALWRKVLRRLRFAVDLLGAIQAHDQAALASWITLGSDGSAKYDSGGVEFVSGFVGGSGHPLAPMIQRGGLVAAGWCVFQQLVNGSLNCRRQVLWDEHGRLRRFDVPETLLGAAWMQLSEAGEGGLIVRRCPRCSSSYPVRPTSRRKHDVYCSTACRVAAYRKRKKARQPPAKAAAKRRTASGRRSPK